MKGATSVLLCVKGLRNFFVVQIACCRWVAVFPRVCAWAVCWQTCHGSLALPGCTLSARRHCCSTLPAWQHSFPTAISSTVRYTSFLTRDYQKHETIYSFYFIFLFIYFFIFFSLFRQDFSLLQETIKNMNQSTPFILINKHCLWIHWHTTFENCTVILIK